MKKYPITGLVMLCSFFGISQTLEKAVVSASGSTNKAVTVAVEQVIGEPLVLNRKGTTTQISEGFLQGYKVSVQPLARKSNVSNEPTVSVYPNPTTSYVTISGITTGYTIQLVNAKGGIVTQQQKTGESELNLINYTAGSYVLNITAKNKQLGVYQIIKQ